MFLILSNNSHLFYVKNTVGQEIDSQWRHVPKIITKEVKSKLEQWCMDATPELVSTLSQNSTISVEGDIEYVEKHSKIEWVFRNTIDSGSQTEWRSYEQGAKRRKIKVEDWRNDVQMIQTDTPPYFSIESDDKFPRIVDIPSTIEYASVFIKNGDGCLIDETQCLYGCRTKAVDKTRREIEFPEFKFIKSSYNENLQIYESWTIVFQLYNADHKQTLSIESRPIHVYSNTPPKKPFPKIYNLYPHIAKIGVPHAVAIEGDFSQLTEFDVFFGDEKTEHRSLGSHVIVVDTVLSFTPKYIQVYIQTLDDIKSNTLTFTFNQH